MSNIYMDCNVLQAELDSDDPLPKGNVKPESITKVSPLNSWVQKVATGYLNDDTLEFIKFCFEGDEGISKGALEEKGDFRNLFYFIRKHRYADDTSNTLSRFVHIFNQVCGHRQYGKRALELLEEKQIQLPEVYVESKEPPIVQLHHCLSKIASRLSPEEETNLRSRYAKDLKLNTKSKSMGKVLSLFRYLLHNKRITELDQCAFMHMMIAINAKSKLIYLKRYREQNDLSMVAYGPIMTIGKY